jgi:hypothetical protein
MMRSLQDVPGQRRKGKAVFTSLYALIHVTAREQLDGFSCNLILEVLIKTRRVIFHNRVD